VRAAGGAVELPLNCCGAARRGAAYSGSARDDAAWAGAGLAGGAAETGATGPGGPAPIGTGVPGTGGGIAVTPDGEGLPGAESSAAAAGQLGAGAATHAASPPSSRAAKAATEIARTLTHPSLAARPDNGRRSRAFRD